MSEREIKINIGTFPKCKCGSDMVLVYINDDYVSSSESTFKVF